jgi:outer membrane protein OmpA-like peptidoglycan-associated protein
MMKPMNRISTYSIAASFFLIIASASASQAIKTSLFQQALQARQTAAAVQASLLSPRNFSKAMKFYAGAEQKFQRGRNLDSIRTDLAAATQYFTKATQASKRAQRQLAALIKTRGDAEKVQAARYSSTLWQRAEQKFSKAVGDLERGADESAGRAAEADRIYRDAELNAIKVSYLTEARLLLARAEKLKVSKYAPKTLQKSRMLLQQAEKALNDNRYDTDLPRNLARQADYEAKHAIYIAEVVKSTRAKRLTTEDLILDWEIPVKDIAAAADISARLDKGYGPPTEQIIIYIEDQRSRSQRLGQDVNALQAEVQQLQRMLGGVSKERVALSGRLEAQARVRKQFGQIEKMFSRDEARVYRESKDVIIRLVGLSFDVGQSTIRPANYRLLTKVQQAIQAFPNSKLVIEGHTDSHGSDTANYTLSERRAEAVKQYILANSRINASKIAAVGYGETKPVANNETTTGRARNRRIDIVIRPQLMGY